MKHVLALEYSVLVFLVRITVLSLLYIPPNGSTYTSVSTSHGRHARKVYLCMCTLVVHLGQSPVGPSVSGEEYGVLLPRLLFQLDSDGD